MNKIVIDKKFIENYNKIRLDVMKLERINYIKKEYSPKEMRDKIIKKIEEVVG